MPQAEIYRHQFENGLVLLAEAVGGAESLAMSVLVPAGLAQEPAGQQGVSALLTEMICRGAGPLNSRQHSDALDTLGVQRGTAVETSHLHVGATMLAVNASMAIPLLLDMVIRPTLADDQLAPARDLSLQSIDALDDDPQNRVFIALRARHFRDPFGRSPLGSRKDLESITAKQMRSFAKAALVPGGAVIGVAGRFDWPALRDQIGSLTAAWKGVRGEPGDGAAPPRGVESLTQDTSQVHIGLAYDAPAEPDPASAPQKVAAAILSGGMSGRLFTEVREKRGLCYSVYAAYVGQKRYGSMLCYAGTTAPRAQETLDVTVNELRRLAQGADRSEYDRAMVGIRSRLVMMGESTSARAHGIAADHVTLGHPRTLGEIEAQLAGVTLDALNRYLREHPPGDMTIVTIGPSPLRI